MKLLRDKFELFEVHSSVLVLVEKGEDFAKSVFGLGLTNFATNELKELGKSDGFIFVSETGDKTDNEGVSLVKTKFFKSLVDFCGVNAAALIFVEDLEGVLELFVVFGSESVLPGKSSSLGWLWGGGGGLGGSAHL